MTAYPGYQKKSIIFLLEWKNNLYI